jgi:hypothetical protein
VGLLSGFGFVALGVGFGRMSWVRCGVDLEHAYAAVVLNANIEGRCRRRNWRQQLIYAHIYDDCSIAIAVQYLGPISRSKEGRLPAAFLRCQHIGTCGIPVLKGILAGV